ncbi:MAG: cyanophycinase [Phycisphaerales bacterium]|nr:cyanophycinase [Phycisphaerales bacterium]
MTIPVPPFRLVARLAAPFLVIFLATSPRPALGQGYICAEGGGGVNRGDWVSPIFEWMVTSAREGMKTNGRELRQPLVVVLGSRDDDAPGDPQDKPPEGSDHTLSRFVSAGAAASADLWVTAANADTDATYATIAGADIIWMRGGDQSRYVKFWKGTKTEGAIREVFKKGGVVGGTSAGCAVLGQVIYDALGGSAYSTDVLADGRSPKITMTTGFLGLTPGVIFDTHFTERTRITRLAVMLGQCQLDRRPIFLGVGVDTRTAVCISPDGMAEVRGQGAATVVFLTGESDVVLEAGKPPVVTNISYMQCVAGDRFSTRLPDRFCPHHNELPSPLNSGPVRPGWPAGGIERLALKGDDDASAEHGCVRVEPTERPNALLDGELKVRPGTGRLPGFVVQPQTFDSTTHDENRFGGGVWALASHPGACNGGIFLSTGCDAAVEPDGKMRVSSWGERPLSALLLDTSRACVFDFAQSKTNSESAGPRQAVGLEGARLHVLAPGWGYDLAKHRVLPPEKATTNEQATPVGAGK